MCMRKTSKSERPLTLLLLLSQRRAEFHRTVNAVSSCDKSSLSESAPAFELAAVMRMFIDPTPNNATDIPVLRARVDTLTTFCRHIVDVSSSICEDLTHQQ